MQTTRKFIQTFRLVLAVAVVIYFILVLRIPSSATPNPILLRAFGLLAIAEVVVLFVMRRIQLVPAESVLASAPQDMKALLHWRQGHIITYSLSLSIALYGLVLHFLGFALSQVVPFFVAGFALIVFLGPKQISSDAVQQSGHIVPR